MNMKSQDEFHDIVDETEPTQHKCKRETSVSPNCLMLKLNKMWSCMLSFLYTPEAISEIYTAKTWNKPKRISPFK